MALFPLLSAAGGEMGFALQNPEAKNSMDAVFCPRKG
jgi:hypothetical protein